MLTDILSCPSQLSEQLVESVKQCIQTVSTAERDTRTKNTIRTEAEKQVDWGQVPRAKSSSIFQESSELLLEKWAMVTQTHSSFPSVDYPEMPGDTGERKPTSTEKRVHEQRSVKASALWHWVSVGLPQWWLYLGMLKPWPSMLKKDYDTI